MKEFIKFTIEEAWSFSVGLYSFVVIGVIVELIRYAIERMVKWIGNKINQYRKADTLHQ